MTFNDYQNLTITTAIYDVAIESIAPCNPDAQVLLRLSYVGLGLGEVGEIQGKLKKIIRDSGGSITSAQRAEISKELGDVLWYCAQLASELGLSLEEVAQQNIDKLFSRKERGVLQGSGDNR